MTGTDVRYVTRNREMFDGYLTGPHGNANASGILLITAIFGVDQEMRELADAWAGDGFIVSVPHIFWRQTPGPTARIPARDRTFRSDRTVLQVLAHLRAVERRGGVDTEPCGTEEGVSPAEAEPQDRDLAVALRPRFQVAHQVLVSGPGAILVQVDVKTTPPN